MDTMQTRPSSPGYTATTRPRGHAVGTIPRSWRITLSPTGHIPGGKPPLIVLVKNAQILFGPSFPEVAHKLLTEMPALEK